MAQCLRDQKLHFNQHSRKNFAFDDSVLTSATTRMSSDFVTLSIIDRLSARAISWHVSLGLDIMPVKPTLNPLTS